MCMGCAVVCTLLLIFGFITDITFRDIILGTVAVYVAGGTAQKFKSIEVAHEPEINPGYQNRDRENGDRY